MNSIVTIFNAWRQMNQAIQYHRYTKRHNTIKTWFYITKQHNERKKKVKQWKKERIDRKLLFNVWNKWMIMWHLQSVFFEFLYFEYFEFLYFEYFEFYILYLHLLFEC